MRCTKNYCVSFHHAKISQKHGKNVKNSDLKSITALFSSCKGWKIQKCTQSLGCFFLNQRTQIFPKCRALEKKIIKKFFSINERKNVYLIKCEKFLPQWSKTAIIDRQNVKIFPFSITSLKTPDLFQFRADFHSRLSVRKWIFDSTRENLCIVFHFAKSDFSL